MNVDGDFDPLEADRQRDQSFVARGGVAGARVAEGAGDAAEFESEVGGDLLLRESFGGEDSALALGGVARALVDAEAGGTVHRG